jgi:hypothetical protein
MSQNQNSDIKTLRKNQPKILKNVLEGYNFSPKEINQINDNYLKTKDKYVNIKDYLSRPESSGRECLLYDIYEATEIESLIKVNDFLGLKIKNPDEELLRTLNILGIIQE